MRPNIGDRITVLGSVMEEFEVELIDEWKNPLYDRYMGDYWLGVHDSGELVVVMKLLGGGRWHKSHLNWFGIDDNVVIEHENQVR